MKISLVATTLSLAAVTAEGNNLRHDANRQVDPVEVEETGIKQSEQKAGKEDAPESSERELKKEKKDKEKKEKKPDKRDRELKKDKKDKKKEKKDKPEKRELDVVQAEPEMM